MSSFQYFVTFIDDYSHCTWLYLMKIRSKVLFTFKTVCVEVRNLFKINVQILESDNALENFSIAFTQFMSS